MSIKPQKRIRISSEPSEFSGHKGENDRNYLRRHFVGRGRCFAETGKRLAMLEKSIQNAPYPDMFSRLVSAESGVHPVQHYWFAPNSTSLNPQPPTVGISQIEQIPQERSYHCNSLSRLKDAETCCDNEAEQKIVSDRPAQ